ncbi:3359_t:CDS:2, partial [Scutellospora calospora]
FPDQHTRALLAGQLFDRIVSDLNTVVIYHSSKIMLGNSEIIATSSLTNWLRDAIK